MRACTLCRKLLTDDAAACPDDAAASIEVPFESLPTSLAVRFPDLKPLALGATGTLYLVSGAEGATPVTKLLKVLAKSLTRTPAERATYRRELRRQINLAHPHVSAVLEEGESEERAWLLREYVSGESLAVCLRREEKPTESLVYTWIAQLADALDALHRLGIAHGDLKPSHVLLSEGARGLDMVHLIDAALAAPLSPPKASIRGTAEYIAPEVIEGAAPTFRSDLYALGCISHQLLAGAPPFQGVTQAATLAAQRESPAPELPATVPQSLRRLVASMLEKDPRRRPFSAQQVKRTVETLLPAAAAAAAASSGGRSVPQPPAAALRAAPAAAKSQAPAPSRDATVELDVKDLDEAIDASDATPERTQPLHSVELLQGRAAARGPESEGKAPPKAATLVDDDAPTIALATLNAKEVLADVHRAARSASAGSGAPKSSATGTHFGLGPVRAQDVAAAAAAAERKASAEVSEPEGAAQSEPVPAPAAETAPASALPAVVSSAKRSGFAPVTEQLGGSAQHGPAPRTNAGAQLPLTRRPSILLWAAGGLLALVLMLRLALGPGHARTSQSVVVRVPEAPTEPEAIAPVAVLSERGLIGGNLSHGQVYTRVEAQLRTPVTPEPAQPVAVPVVSAVTPVTPVAPATPAHSAAAVASGQHAVAEPAEDEPQAAEDADSASGSQPAVPTVSAAQVGRSLARAAQTRASVAAEVDYKVRGRELYQAGKFREAAEAYQRATERNAADAGAYAGLGASFLAAGDAGKAIAAYKRAVQIEPAVSGFQAALGRAYLKKGDRTQARAAYAKALTLDPNNQAAKSGMASAKVR